MTVVFDGYASSPKDHDHKRRLKYYCTDIKIRKDISCTTPKKKLLSNLQNKTQLIKLLAGIFRHNGINVVIAKDDADTLIVSTALSISFKKMSKLRVKIQMFSAYLHITMYQQIRKCFFTTAKSTYAIDDTYIQ